MAFTASSGTGTLFEMVCTPREKSPFRETPTLYHTLCFGVPSKASAIHCVTCLPVISLLFWPDASTAEKICTSKFKSSPRDEIGIVNRRSYSLSDTVQLNFCPGVIVPVHAFSGPVSLSKAFNVAQYGDLPQVRHVPLKSTMRTSPTSAIVVWGFTKLLAFSFKRSWPATSTPSSAASL